ncbi:TIGR01906 family membrane protein [Lapidilactobacillus wuchangensis]|uniref:TIGR01906 family membrane protein n=1 Tax=Lapidilactobacillus wuchangensis TaxID=2486001 RepID=UPI000F79E435|nr:TIGR01906 family membrane protein [Lapidilactobacillus wuchangensis]
MKKNSLAVLNWVALIFACISFTAIATILLTLIMYPLEIKGQHLTSYGLSATKLNANYQQLMAYLNFPWVGKLVMSDFPTSASGAAHFADVKRLFLLAWALLIVTVPWALAFLGKLRQRRQLDLLKYPAEVGALLPVAIALIASLNFDQFFVTFHHLFFRNSNWLFDPNTDPIILVLPESFFSHCFILAFVIFEALMITGIIRARRSWR